MLIIGSYALGHWYPDYLDSKPVDIDIIGEGWERRDLQYDGYQGVSGRAFKMYGTGTIVDFEVAEPGSSANEYLAEAFVPPNVESPLKYVPEIASIARIASPAILYSLKRSHRHRPRAWHKHIADYHFLKPKVDNYDRYVNITMRRTEEYGPIKTPALNKSAAEFFRDKVSNRVFVHDQIHEIMAHGARPMYERISKDDGTVASDKGKFNALTLDEQCQCVLEEAYVIALERGIIPMLFNAGPRATAESTYRWAIMRICTTLTSGWFRDFATENLPAICERLDRRYVDKFLTAADDGRIQRIAA